jgi:uncharacterized protein (DUF2336 family)
MSKPRPPLRESLAEWANGHNARLARRFDNRGRTSDTNGVASVTPEVQSLTRWATSRSASDRNRLLLALANVVAADDLSRKPQAQGLMNTLLPALAETADELTRAELGERLAEAPWAPPALLAALAREPLEVSRPLLARSRAIDAASLRAAALEGGPSMHVVLARRSDLPSDVVDLLLKRSWPDAMVALAQNTDIRLSPEQLDRLADSAQHNLALKGPLRRRPEMTPARLRELEPEPQATDSEEGRYVSKLERCGRLTPGFAFRVLREGRLGLFEHALATLGGLSAETVRQACDAETPEPLMRACAAGGLDRAVAPAVAARVRELNGGRPGAGPATQ